MQITVEPNAHGCGFRAFDQRCVNDPPYRVGFGQTAAEAILDLLTVALKMFAVTLGAGSTKERTVKGWNSHA